MDFHEFPKMYYKQGEEPRTVNNEEEAKALGKGWQEKPVSVPVEDQSKITGLNTNPLPPADPRIVPLPNERDGANPKAGADEKGGVN